MDKIEKLFRKLIPKDREALLLLLERLLGSDKNLNIVKIVNTDFFRIKQGKFRIIFHREGERVVVDSVRLRDDNTYKNL